MTQIGFSGSGTESPSEDQINLGQGLQTGNTLIDFSTGKIKRDNGKVSELIGFFRNFRQQSKDSNLVRTFVFRAKSKCTIKYQKTSVEYNLINEYIILNGINTDKIEIERDATNISPDVFDWDFIASDDPLFKLSIEKGTRDSDIETIFSSASRPIDTYYQPFNVQGANKIILTGKATAEGGQVDISCEILDPSSNTWIEHIPSEIIFSLTNGDLKRAQIGEGISYVPKDEDIKFIEYDLSGEGNPSILTDVESRAQATIRHFAPYGTFIGFVLPSGDNLIRIKAVVTVDNLTFSLGIIKVFN